ncbi:hypothetical protein SGHV016 [Glossina pallidipes salivary gland hypertrophy virus]|nr:hypothetical protein SGHV016 [Glossina pallidipes salivary gland hypertrophy virus]ABQ08789.1 hypothetical protein SGHV016 [Glossina pallidipes salivary gland hypertrophy virus]
MITSHSKKIKISKLSNCQLDHSTILREYNHCNHLVIITDEMENINQFEFPPVATELRFYLTDKKFAAIFQYKNYNFTKQYNWPDFMAEYNYNFHKDFCFYFKKCLLYKINGNITAVYKEYKE